LPSVFFHLDKKGVVNRSDNAVPRFLQGDDSGAEDFTTGGLYRDYGNKYLNETMDVPLEDGLLVLFPSYLLHSGLPYRGGKDRVLIAFNAQVHIREGSPSATRARGAH
jgi:hypothetical protein